jgi:alkylresorcinol/alkylpyrone synthase
MYLLSLATSNPPHSFTQAETWHALQFHPAFPSLKPRSISLLEKILTSGSSGIESRQFTTADLAPVFRQDAEELNRSFEAQAPALAADALTKALETSKLAPKKIDALFLCTCTGYLCPGPSSHVAETLGLRPDTYL